MCDSFRKLLSRRASLIQQAGTSIVLSVFFYLFMEWIFLITKPSFLDVFNLGDKVIIFLVASLFVSLLALLFLPLLFLLDVILSPVFHSIHRYIYFIPVAFVLISLCLILLDNFTYTIFHFGIVNSKSFIRALYALIFVFGIFVAVRKLGDTAQKPGTNNTTRFLSRSAMVLISISLVLAGFTYKPDGSSKTANGQNTGMENNPNIILFSSDGVNADNMSAYGYERDTTPFISELAGLSLLSQNNFSNTGSSIGSETATLTGKLPLSTRVLITNNTLQGIDKYQHLPGLLKNAGYRTISLGVKSYVDVNAINFQNAFDEVNCEENIDNNLPGNVYGNEIYLLTSIGERITDRLKHIFFIQEMQNPYSLVTNAMTSDISDEERVQCLYSYLDDSIQSGQPIFAHVHLMGTHGPEFDPDSQTFSKDENQDSKWMTDFYDDTIVDYDKEVQQLVQYLQDHDLFDNTILVMYTDHGQKWSTVTRIPLILHFPHDQYAGIITKNTQNLDIAPTLLDYLDIEQPDWMTGSSLLEPLDPNRLILGAHAVRNEDSSGNVITDEASIPPFYQFGSMSVIQCQNVHVFDMQHSTVKSGIIKDYPDPCPADTLDSQSDVQEYLGKVFVQAGFELPEDW